MGPHHVHPPARGRSWAWRPRHLHPMTRPGAQWCQGNATQSSTQGLARRQALCLHPLPAACQPWRPLDGACLTKRPRPCDQALLPVLLQVLVPREFFPLTPFSICAAPSPEASSGGLSCEGVFLVFRCSLSTKLHALFFAATCLCLHLPENHVCLALGIEPSCCTACTAHGSTCWMQPHMMLVGEGGMY